MPYIHVDIYSRSLKSSGCSEAIKTRVFAGGRCTHCIRNTQYTYYILAIYAYWFTHCVNTIFMH